MSACVSGPAWARDPRGHRPPTCRPECVRSDSVRPAEPVRTASRATAGCSPSRPRPRGPGSSRRFARSGAGGCHPSIPVRRLSGFRRGQARAAIRRRSPPGLGREELPDGHGGGDLVAARGKLSCARVVRTTRAQDTRVSVSVSFSVLGLSLPGGEPRDSSTVFPARSAGTSARTSAWIPGDRRGAARPRPPGHPRTSAGSSAAKRWGGPCISPGERVLVDRDFDEPASRAAVSRVPDVALALERPAELLDVVRRQTGLLAERRPARPQRAGAGVRLRAEPVEHRVLVPGHPAELQVLVDRPPPLEEVVGAGGSRSHVSLRAYPGVRTPGGRTGSAENVRHSIPSISNAWR